MNPHHFCERIETCMLIQSLHEPRVYLNTSWLVGKDATFQVLNGSPTQRSSHIALD